jgi:glycosyltransferase involved in cell wall biosynthesis
MHILYHHRTGATDAQRVHILEIVRALRALGHTVVFEALVDPEAVSTAPEPSAPSRLGRMVGALKRSKLGYDLLQVAYNFYAVPKLIRAARRIKADAIYERHAMFNVAGVLAARWLKIPVIIEVNSPLAMELKRDNAVALEGLGRAMESWGLNRAHKVLAVTTPLKDILVSIGVRPSQITVMPNGIDPKYFASSAAPDLNLKQALGLKAPLIAGFVGWFRDWHGIDKLIDATAKVIAKGHDMGLLLIGDGPARPALDAQIAKLGLQDRIKITGSLPHDQVPKHLALVDIAVQPAANEYCCPMKVIEYMGMGKAIVAPDQPNLSELIADGVDGKLFAPGDVGAMASALEDLTAHAAVRQALGAQAAHAITQRGLLWSSNAARVVEIFQTGRP